MNNFALAPLGATILSFVLWLHKQRVHDHKQLLENFNKLENCVIELTMEIKEVRKFNKHLHECVHEMRDRINKIDDRLWDHTKNNECDQ